MRICPSLEWTGGPPQQDLQDKAKVDILQCPKGPLLQQMDWLFPFAPPYPTIPFKLQYPICHILGHLDTQ